MHLAETSLRNRMSVLVAIGTVALPGKSDPFKLLCGWSCTR